MAALYSTGRPTSYTTPRDTIRWDLRKLGEHETAGYLSGKSGTRFEKEILRKAFGEGIPAVLNDLTNTLRHGDVTIFPPSLSETGGFLVVEAKSGIGGPDAREHRQMKALKELETFLTTGRREVNGVLTWRKSATEHPSDHRADIDALTTNLRPGTWRSRLVEPGLAYVVLDCACEADVFDEAFSSALGPLGETPAELPRFVLCSNDLKGEGGFYPFPLLFQDVDALFHFYNGDFLIYVIVDLNYVNTRLNEHGYSIRVSKNQDFPWQLLPLDPQAENSSTYLRVGAPFIGRLAAEFVHLNWLIDNIVALPQQIGK